MWYNFPFCYLEFSWVLFYPFFIFVSHICLSNIDTINQVVEQKKKCMSTDVCH
jgi:hypothetical protein